MAGLDPAMTQKFRAFPNHSDRLRTNGQRYKSREESAAQPKLRRIGCLKQKSVL
jgi:hypothetical protein